MSGYACLHIMLLPTLFMFSASMQDAKLRHIENILILSGDHLYRMNYMDFVQVRFKFLTEYSIDIWDVNLHD